jgi:hypothetical protein
VIVDDRKVEVEPIKRMWLPSSAKRDGGSYFDDEMETYDAHMTKQQRESLRIRTQLNERPDHFILVGSAEARETMRKVCNFWKAKGEIGHFPTIKIDYGIPEGEMRIGER